MTLFVLNGFSEGADSLGLRNLNREDALEGGNGVITNEQAEL